MNLTQHRLDLRYKTTYRETIPDAYERLLLDVLRGDKSLFIRADELAAAWDIFTPLLDEIECCDRPPEFYPFGTNGPNGVRELAGRHGFNLSS